MDNPEGSLTSAGAAGLRAAHQLLDGEPKLLSDPVILRLLDAGQLDRIRNNPLHFQEPRLMGLRSHIVLRSRYAEDRLAQAYARGVRQYLLLGAGLDTFAWRQPPELEALRIFEADHPATQAQKKQRLEQAGIRMPVNCALVPVDFESESVAAALQKSSFDFKAPCFISCLGVMIYLSMEAIDAIFRFVVGLPASTEFVFTFAQRRVSPDLHPTAARVAEIGEPWRTYQRPDELAWKLGSMGYSSLDFLQPEEAEVLYYTGRPHGLPAPLHSGIARAMV
jgi:methyltransferase (TIGR00027 family)